MLVTVTVLATDTHNKKQKLMKKNKTKQRKKGEVFYN